MLCTKRLGKPTVFEMERCIKVEPKAHILAIVRQTVQTRPILSLGGTLYSKQTESYAGSKSTYLMAEFFPKKISTWTFWKDLEGQAGRKCGSLG